MAEVEEVRAQAIALAGYCTEPERAQLYAQLAVATAIDKQTKAIYRLVDEVHAANDCPPYAGE